MNTKKHTKYIDPTSFMDDIEDFEALREYVSEVMDDCTVLDINSIDELKRVFAIDQAGNTKDHGKAFKKWLEEEYQGPE